MNVVVVGAGIIGASISRHLAGKGAKVTVLEAGPAAAAGATGKSWAWLNANAKKPIHYRDLNLRSMQLWQQHHAQLCSFCGCLMLHDERPAAADPAYPSQHVAAGSELQGLEPALNPELATACQHAKLYAQEGWCDPVEAAAAFLVEAQAAGATVLYGHKVDHIAAEGGRATAVVCSSSTGSSSGPNSSSQQLQQQQQLPADVVVLAAGVGTPGLCADLGYTLPLLHKPAAIVMTSPLQPGTLQHMLVTDTVFILQRSDGRFLIGETQPSEASNTDTSSKNAARILQLAADAVPALSAAKVQGMFVGYRPYPADGYPVLGWLPSCRNAYVAVTHSGLTLAPLVGQLVAEEVMASSQGTGGSTSSLQETAELLSPYRPNRSFPTVPTNTQSGTGWAAVLGGAKR